MNLEKHIDWRFVFVGLYFLAFLVYVAVGIGSTAGAKQYDVESELLVPAIDLSSDVTRMELEGRKLNTPDTIVGSYSNHDNKTLLIGHASTVFHDLNKVQADDLVIYHDLMYKVVSIQTFRKDEINMNQLLEAEKVDTIVLMTCAGEDLGNGDATHRLILEAVRV